MLHNVAMSNLVNAFSKKERAKSAFDFAAQFLVLLFVFVIRFHFMHMLPVVAIVTADAKNNFPPFRA